MTKCLIALGSNLGDRAATLDAAIRSLAASPGIELLSQSAWQMTIAVGGDDPQPEFLNGSALLETSLPPAKLHALLDQIETQHGRQRHQRWGDRTLDLDLLLYGDSIVDTPALIVPHPRMSFRRFVLEPAVEIAGPMVHPTIGWTLDALLEHLDAGADSVVIVSKDEPAGDDLADSLAGRFGLVRSNSPLADLQRWPAASTARLAVPGGRKSTGRPKLSILLDLDRASEMGRGPLVRMASTSRDEVQRETFAAVAAVWPHLGSPAGERLQ
jgi:2-amino-4-hydroxy-6-hydroxymethyldihydropteridine diphosphokinase